MLLNLNLPNWLTLFRIFLIPVLVVVYYWSGQWSSWAAAAIFGVAAITDWLDGYYARRLDMHSSLGAFLDPVADKLIVAVALVLLVETYAVYWMTIPAMVIIGREIVISALREWMAEIGKRANVAVSMIGKVKTTFQMIAILILIALPPYSLLSWIGVLVLYAAAFLTLWSMLLYLWAAKPHLVEEM